MTQSLPLPPPLVPPDCDLRGLEWMPVDTTRVLDSSTFAKTTGDEFKAAFALWCKSWTQKPAGSLPNDEQVLCELSRCKTMAKWKRVREGAMRNWILCEDNRFYHPVVSEKALEALPKRVEFVEKRTATAERKARERDDRKNLFAILRGIGVHADFETSTSRLRDLAEQHHVTPKSVTRVTPVTPTGHGVVTAKTGQDLTGPDTTGPDLTGPDLTNPSPKRTSAGASPQPALDGFADAAADAAAPPETSQAKPKKPRKPQPEGKTTPTWKAYCDAIQLRYGGPPVERDQGINGMLGKFVDRVTAELAPEIARFYVGHQDQFYVRKSHPVNLMLQDAQKLRTEFTNGRKVMATDAGEADRLASTGAMWSRVSQRMKDKAS